VRHLSAVSDESVPSNAIALKAAMTILEPIAGILLTRQVQYSAAAEVLKAAFVQASARAFVAQGKVPSVSTLSVATGIGRVEVKRLLDPALSAKAQKTSPAGRVRLQWSTDPRYLDQHGQPLRLPRVAPPGEASFDGLAAAATLNAHPRAVLDEMLRLRMVAEQGDFVLLLPGLPGASDADEQLLVGANNAGDHLSAMLVNILSSPAPLLERAMFADGLTKASAARVVEAARDVWTKMRAELRETLQTLVDLDADASANHWRLKVGVYSYMAPAERAAPPVSARDNNKRRASKKAGARRSARKRRLAASQSGTESP
jgi:hypothetical protein